MYVRPVVREDQGLIRVLEGKLARLTQRVPNLRIDHIHAAMQEQWLVYHLSGYTL